MQRLVFFILILAFPLFAFSQDYKQYLELSYAEIDSLMYIEYKKRAFDKAIPLMQAGRDKAKSDFGELDSVFAEYTDNLGAFYQYTGQHDKALPLSIQSKSIKEKTVGKDHPSFSASLNNLATLYYSMGNYEEALPLFIQSKNIKEKVLGTDHPDFATALINLASLHQKMGNYEEALPLYIQSKNIREKVLGKDHLSFASSLNSLAILHQKMGNYKLALPLSIESKNIREKILGKNHPQFARALNNLASLHQKMGNYEEALSLSIQSKNIREKVLGTDHPDFATALNNLARLHQRMGNYEDALPLYIQSKNIREKVLGKNHPKFTNSLNNLAELHQELGNYKEAWVLVGEAMKNMSKLQLEHNFSQTWVDSLKTARFASILHLDKMVVTLRIAYQLLGKENVIDVNAKQKNIAHVALFLLDKKRNQTTNDKDKLRSLAQNSDWLEKSLNLFNVEQDAIDAFNLSDQNKSVLLLQAVKSEAAYRLGELPEALVWEDKKQLKKQSKLEAKLLEKRPKVEKDSLRTELININQQIDDFIEMIKKDYPKYHKLKYQQVNIKVEEIQALLDDKTALVEYVISDSILHIFCVEKDKVVWKQEAVLDSVLRANIKRFHTSLSNYNLVNKEKGKIFSTYTDLAYFFYQKLLASVLENKKHIKNLVIVTDGELGHLPFESLLVEAAEEKGSYRNLHYLLKDYNISYNYSATLWQENKSAKKQKNNGQMLAMAARYSEKLDSRLTRSRLPTTRWLRDALSPLPAAREEVEALSAQFKGYFGLDSFATERVLHEKAANYAIIHLAMHGLLDEKRPILSSLALTEDGDSLYDNFWKAHEISKMELNADLVVLSACETGYGRFESGNGIASLARAFMYAGAPSLVVSLWQVNDASTSIIMQNFYEHLASGKTKSEALRQAKLDYLVEADDLAAHPAFWSPFILIGDESPVKLQRKGRGSLLWYGLGAGALVLAGIGFGLARRKRVG